MTSRPVAELERAFSHKLFEMRPLLDFHRSPSMPPKKCESSTTAPALGQLSRLASVHGEIASASGAVNSTTHSRLGEVALGRKEIGLIYSPFKAFIVTLVINCFIRSII